MVLFISYILLFVFLTANMVAISCRGIEKSSTFQIRADGSTFTDNDDVIPRQGTDVCVRVCVCVCLSRGNQDIPGTQG